MSVNANTDDSDVLPPPLPPRSSRNSDDLSPVQTATSISYNELNGGVINLESTNVKLSKSEASVNSDDNNHYTSDQTTDEEIMHSVSEASFSNSSTLSVSESLTELRKRARKEREDKTALMVQNIKKKQKETELWEKRRSIIKLSLGLVLIIGIGYFVYKNYSKS
ncbi:UNVERIFIED_CONTAM: hypothetical protein NCL1_51998 [Trichonephila clavipes]